MNGPLVLHSVWSDTLDTGALRSETLVTAAGDAMSLELEWFFVSDRNNDPILVTWHPQVRGFEVLWNEEG